jgi:hypothetical protein
MKKQTLAALAILGATMGMGAVPQTLPTNQAQGPQSQKHNDGLDKEVTTVRRGPVTPLNPAGLVGNDYFELKQNMSPKEYGQWLQSKGKQKWTKRSKP